MQLKRSVGLYSLVFIAVSGVIGSGWLFGPMYAAQLAGPAALISWLLGAFVMFLLALTYAESSAMLPVPGGIVRLPHITHGNVVSFTMGWSALVCYIMTAPIEVRAALQYASDRYPQLLGPHDTLSWLGFAIGGLMMLIFCIINAVGVAFFARINNSITGFKIVVPIFTALLLIGSHFHPKNFYAFGGFMPYGFKGVFSAVTAGGIIWAFIGFRHVISMAGEARRPKRDIPMALIIGVLICVGIFESFCMIFGK